MSDAAPSAARKNTPPQISVRRLNRALGAEIRGLDLSQPLDDAVFAEVLQAFHDNLVLVFPDQNLSPSQQIAFTNRFGYCGPNPDLTRKTLDTFPEVRTLVNRPGDPGPANDFWHSDVTYFEEPILGSVLHALEVPDPGGDTCFCNMYNGYEQLSPGLRRMLDGLRAVHSARANFLNSGRPLEEMPPPVEHPVIRTHPATGRKSLYVEWHFTEHFAGMTREESKPIIDHVVARAVEPENVYRHRWSVGDVVIWDNRCTLHRSVYDYGDRPRVIHRTTAAGDKPY